MRALGQVCGPPGIGADVKENSKDCKKVSCGLRYMDIGDTEWYRTRTRLFGLRCVSGNKAGFTHRVLNMGIRLHLCNSVW